MSAIVTRRLMIVPWSGNLSDAIKISGWLNNRDIVRFSEQRHHAHTLRSQVDYMESIQPPSLYRLIVRDGRVIGSMTAFVDKNNQIADMGIMIGDKAAQSQGLGTEAWIALMMHLLNTGMRKVEAGCVELNQPMIKIFMRSGMSYEGSRRNHFLVDGEPWSMEMWARYND